MVQVTCGIWAERFTRESRREVREVWIQGSNTILLATESRSSGINLCGYTSCKFQKVFLIFYTSYYSMVCFLGNYSVFPRAENTGILRDGIFWINGSMDNLYNRRTLFKERC